METFHIPIEPTIVNVHEFMSDNPFIAEISKSGIVLYATNPETKARISARDYYFLALEWLDYAKDALKEGKTRLSVDSAYNVIELIMKGLILMKGESLARSHGGILDQFGRLYIITGKVSRQLGKRIHKSLILRNRARYDPRSIIPKEDSEEIVSIAESMVKFIESELYLKE
jgi:uncharacterized protein (UPF0332 family)